VAGVYGARELIRNISCLRGMSVLDLHTQVSPLVAGGWLDPKEPGPLNRAWKVNPVVASQFEQRRKAEEQRKVVAAAASSAAASPTHKPCRKRSRWRKSYMTVAYPIAQDSR
jgi:hypothetical protein